jgi:hypothetical protein
LTDAEEHTPTQQKSNLGLDPQMIPPSTDWLLTNKCGAKGEADLQGEEAVVDLDLLGEEIGADGGLVLVAELFVHVPAPRRGEGGKKPTNQPPNWTNSRLKKKNGMMDRTR